MLIYEIRQDIDHVCLPVMALEEWLGLGGVRNRMEEKASIRYGNLQSSVEQIKDCNHALLAIQI